MALIITDRFDGGNIKVLDSQDPGDVRLEIRDDIRASLFQWFSFQVSNCKSLSLNLKIMNAVKSSYPDGWKGYEAFASYDLQKWFRVRTLFDGQVLSIQHRPDHDVMYFSYFPPFSYDRHQQLLARSQISTHCRQEELGLSAEGRTLSLLMIGTPSPVMKKVWIICRQHPGETMGEWFAKGVLDRLLEEGGIAEELRQRAVIYVVPNMNPDGAILGNLRTNARGANLNREWMNPTLARSPEVYWVRNRIHATGVDFFLDIHGDEDLPYCFAAGCEGVPHYSSRIAGMEAEFRSLYENENPDFQQKIGYVPDEPGNADLRIAANYICETFGCSSLTLERPFKENKGNPSQDSNWDHNSAQTLGASLVKVLAKMSLLST